MPSESRPDNQLVVEDIDWRFGVTVNSSQLIQSNNTFIQLKLKTKSKDNICCQLNLTQFNRLLGELESVANQLND